MRDDHQHWMADHRRLREAATRSAGVMLVVLLVGVLGYRWLEGWSWSDALFMTGITLSTVGYSETHALTQTGRLFTLGLILVGVGNLTYFFGVMTQFFAAGGPAAYRRRAQMEHKLAQIKGHTIVCGYGRLGTEIVAQLQDWRSGVVVVERSAEVTARVREAGHLLCVQGQAEDDDVLRAAGIERAHALVAALDDDAANVFLCLTARELNPKVVIYARADHPATLKKLQRAGADHSFSPSQVAGHRIAWQIMRPAVTDLIGIATNRGATELAIEELRVADMDRYVGVKLQDTPLWGRAGVMVLAVKTPADEVQFPPQGQHVLAADDRLVVMGKVETLGALGVGNTSA